MARIAFLTTLQMSASTVTGRVLPLAQELAKTHEVHMFVMDGNTIDISPVHIHVTGKEPFTRTPQGKTRLRGFALLWRMATNAITTGRAARAMHPDVVVMVKPLPQNVIATRLASVGRNPFIIVDNDDFELAANQLTSIWQRAVIHWSERSAARLGNMFTVATPFLFDIWQQLTGNKKEVVVIPTGINNLPPLKDGGQKLLYAGSISRGSGHRVDLLPEIVRRVRQKFPALAIQIAGGGDDQASLEAEFRRRQIGNVSFTGRFNPDSLGSLLTQQTILIDPIDGSITNRAKSSYRAVLAVASGLPVVTSNIGIRSKIIPPVFHGRFFAKPGDAGDYADKIVGLLENPLTPAEQAALKTQSQQYTWDVLSQKFTKLIGS